ncbi:superoxide dismutase family protein [Sodalis sp. dw_96]|uniref:superoxide dismutase[Cu-Zn] n=1 Tax=Sodalis sp. dw_96 TaxID=2719794 RepID=UPI001BD4A8BF|nr:superoxide dismutase family protein [Sodalis sp. dw_96]
MRRIIIFLVTILFAGPLWAQPNPVVHTGTLLGIEGQTLGKITVTEAPKGVILRIEAAGISPGWHGVHFHEKGSCGAKDKFMDAGSHVHAVTPVVHGILNSKANDAGDLPNVFVGGDGKLTVELYSTLVAVNPGNGRPALLDQDGSSLIIHGKPDDYESQPIGGAGERIACAVIQ